MAYVELDFPSGIRDRKGRFGDAYNKLPIFYRKLAIEVQDEAASIIRADARKRLKNPRKGPRGTLARVTRNPANRLVTKNGFAVGNPGFLARSEAKYARIIEEGSAVAAPRYSGTMITGGWRGNAPPGEQYFIPAKFENRKTGLYRRPIEPLYAYRQAWNRVGVPSRIRQVWRDVLTGEGVTGRSGQIPKGYKLPVTFGGAGVVRY